MSGEETGCRVRRLELYVMGLDRVMSITSAKGRDELEQESRLQYVIDNCSMDQIEMVISTRRVLGEENGSIDFFCQDQVDLDLQYRRIVRVLHPDS